MRTTPTTDVVVIGGGPSGFGAAVGAALEGARVLLIERHAILGGMGTVGLVNNFCGAHHDGRRAIIGGVFEKLRARLKARQAIYTDFCQEHMEPYDPLVYSEEMGALLEEVGVVPLLGSDVKRSSFSDGLSEVELSNGNIVRSKAVVDATGDATIAVNAGVSARVGRPQDGAVMPLTLCYLMGPVDLERAFAAHPELRRVNPATGDVFLWINGMQSTVLAARTNGDLTIPRDNVACVFSVPGRPDFVTVNFGRVFVSDPTDPVQLAEGEQVGRRQVDEGIRFFQKYVAGFEKAELVELARQIGVRQTRQIQGLYTLTLQDILDRRQFDDVIAQCHYPVDIHEPDSDKTTFHWIPVGEHYDIPLRCLIPKQGPKNLIVAGRCISASHEAMASFRVSPSVMAIGEAAGTAAALAAANGCNIPGLDYHEVQAAILRHKGILS
ncbi:MAG: FAD-dependent oxidoreductase [Verrucomicrobiae bacterium]